MLDFDSEDIDGMYADEGDDEEQRLLGPGKPPRHMTYTWWIHPKKAMAMR